jgi:hypothetical protein
MPGYMMKDKKKKMYGYGGEVKKKLETAALNAVSKLTHLKLVQKHYSDKKIK